MTLCLSLPRASAATISRDWKTPGDGLLTYDDVNQREWLDLSQTVLSSQFPGATQADRYAYVIGQTTAGGIFENFRVAKSPDVVALAQSAGINTATDSAAQNKAPTLVLANLLSITHLGANGNKFAAGVIDEVTGSRPPARLSGIFYTSFDTQAGLRIADWNNFQSFSLPGVMLYRPVPEPSVSILLVIAAGEVLRSAPKGQRLIATAASRW